MKEFGRRLEMSVFVDLRSNKTKILDYHLTRPYVAFANVNNGFSIWDYDQQICLKSFNANILESKDMTKQIVIKDIKFFDKETISLLFPYDEPDFIPDDRVFFLKNSWIIIVAENKIFFYDYICEKIEQVTPNMLDNKQPRCVEFVDNRFIAIGCTDGHIKILDIISWNVPKTLRGYHQKVVTNLISYRQSDGGRNKLFSAAADGTLACWSIDNDSPFLKFQMLRGGKASSMDEPLSCSYNRQNHTIATVTTSSIHVWNSINGQEIARYKTIKDSAKNSLSGASFLHHGEINKEFMLGFARGTELLLFDSCQNLKTKTPSESPDGILLFDFKSLREIEKGFRVYSVKVNYNKPSYIFVTTSMGVFIMLLGPQTNTIPNLISSPFYTTFITPLQVKEYINDDFTIKKLTQKEVQKIQSFELVDLGLKLPNIMTLSVNNHQVYCHIIDRTKLDLLHENISCVSKTIIHKLEDLPIFEDEPEVQSSLSGKFFSIWYKKSGIVYVYAVTNKNIILPEKHDNLKEIEILHPCGSITKCYSGAAKYFAWHLDKDEFAILSPVDKENKPVEFKEKSESVSKGIFGSKTIKKSLEIDPTLISKYVLYVIGVSQVGPTKIQCELLLKNDTLQNATKIFTGPYFAVNDRMGEEDFGEIMNPELELVKRELRSIKTRKINFYDYNAQSQKLEKIGKAMIEPLNLFWNLRGTILVLVYDSSFIVYKKNENQELKFFGYSNKSIIQGYFWENLFFYTTETTIGYCCFDLKEGLLDFPIGSDEELPLFLAETFLDEYFIIDGEFIEDSIYPHVQLKPQGHIKILGVYDYKLLLVNSREEYSTIELYHPYTRILLCLQMENIKEAISETSKLDVKTYPYIYEAFNAYGFFKEAEDILDNVKDPQVLAICSLKRSLYEDTVKILSDPARKPVFESDLIEYFSLESHVLEQKINFGDSVLKNSDRLTGFDAIDAPLRKENFIEKYPGLEFCLFTEDSSRKKVDLDSLFDKLLSIFNSSISFTPGNGMVIRSGNQVIQMGSNGMTVINPGGQQVTMGSQGIQISNPSTNIRFNSSGYRGNVNINTNFTSGYDAYENYDSEEYDEEPSNFSDSYDDDQYETNYQYSVNYQISNNGQVRYNQSYQVPQTTYSYSNQYNHFPMPQQTQQQEPPVNPGLTKSQISQLPLSVYTVKKPSTTKTTGVKGSSSKTTSKSKTTEPTSESSSSQACAVCITDYKHGEKLRTLPCMHKYHKECIDPWLMKKSECPICKYDLLEG